MNNKKFIDYVREGSLSPDDDIRNQTEAILLEMRNRDPANFLFECVEAFKNPNENNVTRLTTATILRVSLKDMNVVHDITQDKGELLWDLIPNDLKDYIKEACLGHLESKVQPIMESAAQVGLSYPASICSVCDRAQE